MRLAWQFASLRNTCSGVPGSNLLKTDVCQRNHRQIFPVSHGIVRLPGPFPQNCSRKLRPITNCDKPPCCLAWVCPGLFVTNVPTATLGAGVPHRIPRPRAPGPSTLGIVGAKTTSLRLWAPLQACWEPPFCHVPGRCVFHNSLGPLHIGTKVLRDLSAMTGMLVRLAWQFDPPMNICSGAPRSNPFKRRRFAKETLDKLAPCVPRDRAAPGSLSGKTVLGDSD